MDLNHSDRSEFQDRELIEAVLQKSEDPGRLSESCGSRRSSLALNTHHSLRSTGNLSRPSSVFSRRSGTYSQDKASVQSLCDAESLLKEEEARTNANYEQLKLNLMILLLICVCALVMSSLSLQVVVTLAGHQEGVVKRDTLIEENVTSLAVTEVAIAVFVFVVVCNISCLLVCALQCLIIVKLLKVSFGDERALKYLKECSSSRSIAVYGFFVSVPVFLLALTLYVVLQFTKAAAVTAIVILLVGGVFCVLSLVQNSYHWRRERSRAHRGLPVFDCVSNKHSKNEKAFAKELSTLV